MPYKKNPAVYLLRSNQGVHVYSLDSNESCVPSLIWSVKDTILQACWSPGGSYITLNCIQYGVRVYRHPSWKEPEIHPYCVSLSDFGAHSFSDPQTLKHIQWSPLETYLVCFWKYDSNRVNPETRKNIKKNLDPVEGRNVLIWQVMHHDTSSTGSFSLKLTGSFTLKGIVPGQWPIIQWRNDERYCCVASRSDICIYDGSNVGGTVIFQLQLNAILNFSVAPRCVNETSDSLILAGFHPDSQAATLSIASIVNPVEKEWSISVEKSLGGAESCRIQWNKYGSALVALASVSVDTIGENYGEVGDAYLLSIDGSLTEKLNSDVAQDISWSPTKNEFLLIQGRCPSDILLYNDKGIVLYRFPKAYCNTICWDPLGRMLALGGFGNLAGDIYFWHRSHKSSQEEAPELIFKWREACTVLCQWSSDARFFFTASTFPRMKVDNCLKIFTCEGTVLLRQNFHELFDFQWKPLYFSEQLEELPSPKSQMHMVKHSVKFDLESLMSSQNQNIFQQQNTQKSEAAVSKVSLTTRLPQDLSTRISDRSFTQDECNERKCAIPFQMKAQRTQKYQCSFPEESFLQSNAQKSKSLTPSDKLEEKLKYIDETQRLDMKSSGSNVESNDKPQSSNSSTESPELLTLLRKILPREAQIRVATTKHSSDQGHETKHVSYIPSNTPYASVASEFKSTLHTSENSSSFDTTRKPLYTTDELSQYMLSCWSNSATSRKGTSEHFRNTQTNLNPNRFNSFENLSHSEALYSFMQQDSPRLASPDPLQNSPSAFLNDTYLNSHPYSPENPFDHSKEAPFPSLACSNNQYKPEAGPPVFSSSYPFYRDRYSTPSILNSKISNSYGSHSIQPCYPNFETEQYSSMSPFPPKDVLWKDHESFSTLDLQPNAQHTEIPLPSETTFSRSKHFPFPLETLQKLWHENSSISNSYNGTAPNHFPLPVLNPLDILSLENTMNARTPPISQRMVNPYKDACWEYLDAKGQIQGPFSLAQIKAWHTLNYIPSNLLVRISPSSELRPFSYVIKLLNA